MGKGESMGQKGIGRHAAKEKGNRKPKPSKTSSLWVLQKNRLALLDTTQFYSFKLKGCDRTNIFHPDLQT